MDGHITLNTTPCSRLLLTTLLLLRLSAVHGECQDFEQACTGIFLNELSLGRQSDVIDSLTAEVILIATPSCVCYLQALEALDNKGIQTPQHYNDLDKNQGNLSKKLTAGKPSDC